MQTHPLKVYHSGSGIFFLLQWWTHAEQHHVVLSRSKVALDLMVKHLATKYTDLCLKQAYQIELVAPSQQMCERAAVLRLKEEVDHFLHEVTCSLHTLVKSSTPLPEPFKRCEVWAPTEDSYSESENGPDSYAQTWHPDCRYCTNGIRLSNDYTPEKLYHLWHQSWLKQHPQKIYQNHKNPIPQYSRAESAQDDEAIWVAWPDFGPHSRGVDLANQLDQEPTREVLFYFRKRRELDVTQWTEIINKAEELRKEYEAATFATRSLRHRTEDQKAIEKILTVFTSSS